MRRSQHLLLTGISALLLCGWLACSHILAQADTETSAPSLGISQLKITSGNGQFITLYNSTIVAQDLSHYQLEYFNSYDLTKATTSKLIALSGTMPPHSYYMINDGTLAMCYRLTLESVSLGLSSTAGLLELLSINQAEPGAPLQTSVQDYVGWSKTSAAGAQTLPTANNSFLLRQPLDSNRDPQIISPGSGNWSGVQMAGDGCSLTSIAGQSLDLSPPAQLLLSQEPPATIVSLNSQSAQTAVAAIPTIDNGLMSPKITELLPNPNGSGNDAADEFIELYNPNPTNFDLSGFQLQTGLASTHKYTFPVGTVLMPNSFTAFYSSATHLSLSNSSGQAALLDPLGAQIGQTDAYSTASDGQAWALANSKWYWTINPTPNAINSIKQPSLTKATSSKKSGSGATKSLKNSAAKTPSSTGRGSDTAAAATPVQPWLLALIGVIALLYGAYEYRRDLANKYYQLRRYLSAGRRHWPKIKGRRGD